MSKLDDLKKLLKELFQLDRADLDFGIYRIMHYRAAEIESFLENDLLPQVRAALDAYSDAHRKELKHQLEAAREDANKLGVDPDSVPKVAELQAKISDASETDRVETEVYSDLYRFFRRYYSDGDFLTLRRRHAGDVYSIPYSGEEVKLHWANADQYYIKSSENLTNYSFKVHEGKTVRFELVAAAVEKDNNKAQDGAERRYSLAPEYMSEETTSDGAKELVVKFEYRPGKKGESQKELNAKAAAAVGKDSGHLHWRRALLAKAPTEANPDRVVFEKHLATYTAKHSFDYFIHKDLGGFLRRELDFFIKNEIMQLDDIESETAPRVERYLAKIKAIRRVAERIIGFLAQLEEFQKKLWLKKKFVLETNWCASLSHAPSELVARIVDDRKQQREWRALGLDLTSITQKSASPSKCPNLIFDTSNFSEDVAFKFLSQLEDVHSATNGLVVAGDNFHGLRLVERVESGSAKCIFIDPPYNTGNDGFIYKDRYQHSSWLCMMQDRLHLGRLLLRSDGAICATIDDNEHAHLRELFGQIFGDENFVANVAWQKRYTRSNNTNRFTSVIDHVQVFARTPDFNVSLFPREGAADSRYTNPDDDPRGPWKAIPFTNPRPARERLNLCYPITNPNTRKPHQPKGEEKAWRRSEEEFEKLEKDGRVYWGNSKSAIPNIKAFLSEVRDGMTPINLWEHAFASHTDEAKNELKRLFGFGIFDNPKPTKLVERVIELVCGKETDALVIDFFAGSGTTAQAVLNANRRDQGSRRFLLIESGAHVDRIIVPRIKKCMSAPSWKSGRPEPSNESTRYLFKYLHLESYDDTLNNIELKRDDSQQSLLDRNTGLRADYTLRYMLDVESRESLLNVERFVDPWAYKLRVTRDGETRLQAVDLIETFNWLLGLKVAKYRFDEDLAYVRGEEPGGSEVLIIWRRVAKVDSARLNAWFEGQRFASTGCSFDKVYVNGDNLLGTVRGESERWTVHLIEDAFDRLMFDTAEG